MTQRARCPHALKVVAAHRADDADYCIQTDQLDFEARSNEEAACSAKYANRSPPALGMTIMTAYRDFYGRSITDREAFWRTEAALIDWQTPFDRVLDYSQPPFARWFVGGRTNLCHNAIDRHLAERADQPALV